MLSHQQADVLAAANFYQLVWEMREPHSRQGEGDYMDSVSKIKFSKKVIQQCAPFIKMLEKSPDSHRIVYQLSPDGEIAYKEYLQQLADIARQRKEAGESEPLAARVVAVNGHQRDGRRFDKADIDLIRLSYGQGLSYAEIARIHKCSAAMIRNIVLGNVYKDML